VLQAVGIDWQGGRGHITCPSGIPSFLASERGAF
jgi:hypothetical protein